MAVGKNDWRGSDGKKYFDMAEFFEWKKSQPQAAEAKVRSIK